MTSWLQISRDTVGKDPHRPPWQGCRLGAPSVTRTASPSNSRSDGLGAPAGAGCVCSRAVAEQCVTGLGCLTNKGITWAFGAITGLTAALQCRLRAGLTRANVLSGGERGVGCGRCGATLEQGDRFCGHCGAPVG